ncbi:hypothetical protein [Campylobacter lari]|uniref:hypothetical protein n=1 Tax=Campylobacter lari TaxID=201 RepID=UPI000E192B2F|nr:hypothetical protein [Campylobacter lari]SUX05510.1 Uncharacterised protein [Campylobacter lari]
MNFIREHEIRLCNEFEYDKLVEFIKINWNKEHIFIKSKELLDYQHLNIRNKNYNFIVACNKITGKFDAILGFIPLSQYDEKLCNGDFWLALWKVDDRYAKTGIGLEVLSYFIKLFNPKSFSAIGITKKAELIYKMLRYKIITLQHFYIASSSVKDFKIASFCKQIKNIKIKKSDLFCKKVDIIDLYKFKNIKRNTPQKSIDYIINRYINHPVYKYHINGFYRDLNCISLFVYRVINVNNSTCLRIVDWFGDFIEDSDFLFQDLLKQYNAEYIDLLCYMEDYDKIIKMGFDIKTEEDIIPNYFEPFKKENVEIKAFYKNSSDCYAIFKGDSDQDRPNLLKEI